MKVWAMSEEADSKRKSKQFGVSRVLLIVVSVAFLTFAAMGAGMIVVLNDGIDSQTASWLIMGIMLAVVAVMTFFVRRMTIKQNCLREYYVLDNGVLSYVNATSLAYDGTTVYSATGYLIKDVIDTAKGLELLTRAIENGTFTQYARRIVSVKSIKPIMGFYVVSCGLEDVKGKRNNYLLHIPQNANEAELLINEFELIMRDR